MIGSLRGELIDRSTDGEVLIEVFGVGHRVVVAPTTAATIGEVGDEIFVWTHDHRREDAQTLYGFATREERVGFEALLSAHGVGPQLALGILSVHAPADLARVLADDDVAALCLVPGVGKKTAARLLVELKSKLDVPESAATAAAGGDPSTRRDLIDALAELGYGPDEVRAAVADLPQDGDVADLLKEALRRLAVS